MLGKYRAIRNVQRTVLVTKVTILSYPSLHINERPQIYIELSNTSFLGFTPAQFPDCYQTSREGWHTDLSQALELTNSTLFFFGTSAKIFNLPWTGNTSHNVCPSTDNMHRTFCRTLSSHQPSLGSSLRYVRDDEGEKQFVYGPLGCI